jgi:hypothetical protein
MLNGIVCESGKDIVTLLENGDITVRHINDKTSYDVARVRPEHEEIWNALYPLADFEFDDE